MAYMNQAGPCAVRWSVGEVSDDVSLLSLYLSQYVFDSMLWKEDFFCFRSKETPMGHRHLGFTSQLADMDDGQDWNQTYPDPRLQLGNGSFILPVENAAAGGVNPFACVNVPMHSNNVPHGSSALEISNYRVANTRPSHDPYMPSSSAGNSGHVMSYVQHEPPCYSGAMGGTVDPQMDHERAQFKRKPPAFSMTFDSGSASGYYSAESSSRLPVQSNSVQPKPVSGPQFWPAHLTDRGPSYGSNNLATAREEFHRNVRSRRSHDGHLRINSSGHLSANNTIHHTPPVNIPAQWSHAPQYLESHRRLPSSDVGSSSRATNRTLDGSGASLSGMEIDGGYHSTHSTPISTRYPSSSSAAFPASGRFSNHGQRVAPYRTMPVPSYGPVGFPAGSSRRGLETALPTRHSRALSIVGRNSERAGRMRNLNDRFEPSPVDDNGHSRWIPEGVAMMNRLSFFDSRNFFDQHRDMRLDIDNMSYEELLALGERIGNVKTGLSEETFLKCLTESIYSSHQVQDGEDAEKCVICLEEYADGESLGRLNCGHEFHVSCIRKWLKRKNTCPICKASAAEEAGKGE